MKKAFKALAGLVLMLIHVRIFHPDKYFKGKRIAIIGAAVSALEKEQGDFIDGFDMVLRLNKSLYTWNPINEKYLGQKTDILIHNFYENIDTGGGGPIDLELFNKYGLQYLLQPRNNKEGWRVVLNYYKKYLKSKSVYLLPRTYYKELEKKFYPYKPTMGFCALYMALQSPCKELFITGFTFFKSPYAPGYRDQLIDMKANKQHIASQGQHDPELEFTFFKELLLQTEIKTVKTDAALYKLLESENYPALAKLSIA